MAEVHYYLRLDSSCPFTDWFDGLDSRSAAKVATAFERMTDGNFGDSKSIGDGVWELRIDFGPGYRIYFGRDGIAIVLLLTGGTKRRQQADIREAGALWGEYKQRKRNT